MSMPHPNAHVSSKDLSGNKNVGATTYRSLTPKSFAWFIGARYTKSPKRNQLVSFLSAISMSGLVVGVALLIMVLSVMNGFDRDLREKILGLVPQAAIFHVNGIDNWPEVIEKIKQTEGVESAAPFVRISALASFRKKTSAVLLYGIDVNEEKRVSLVSDYVNEDTLSRLEREPQTLVLGKGLAEKLNIQKDHRLMLVAPDAERASAAPNIAYYTVIDIIHSQTELDQALALTSLRSASSLKSKSFIASDSDADDRPLQVDGIRLKLNDLFKAADIAYAVKSSLGVGYYQTNWTRTHGNLYFAIQVSKNLVGLLMSLIVAIAAFNVVSTLIMVVVDKQGDIAILRTLGATRVTILMVFVSQGVFIGIIGVFLGLVFGCLGALGLEAFVRFVEQIFNVQFLKSDVYPLTYLPTEIRLGDIIQVSLTAVGLSLLATLYPAWKASKIEPAEALRYE